MKGFTFPVSSPWAAGIVALLLSLAVQLPFANDDFDIGFESMIGARFQGPIQRAWLRGGFFRMGGRPMLSPLPTNPPSGATYASHPPLAHWLFHIPVSAFGLSEFSLRLVPILCSALAAFLLAFFLSFRLGPIAGWTSAILWPSVPMVFFYGRMANYESVVFLFALAACLLVLRGSPRATLWAALLLGLATCADWAAGFFLPGIAVVCWRRHLGWRPFLLSLAAVALAVLSYFLILVKWEGGFAEAWQALTAAKGLAQATETFGVTSFLKAQGHHVITNFGFGACIITLLSTLVCILRIRSKKSDELDLLILCSLIANGINIALFPARAFNHDFWWYYLLLAVVIACVRCVSSLYRRFRIIALVVLLALVLEGADRIATRYDEENTGESKTIAARMDARFGTEDLVVMQGNFGSWQFICKAWIYDGVKHTEDGIALIDRFLAGEIEADHLGIWYPVRLDYENPDVLRHWQSLGATHEQYGESAILKFTRKK